MSNKHSLTIPPSAPDRSGATEALNKNELLVRIQNISDRAQAQIERAFPDRNATDKQKSRFESLPLHWVMSVSAHQRRSEMTYISVAFFLSLILHILLMTIGFIYPPQAPANDRQEMLEVVLVNARHKKAPDNAKLLGQANLDGGGRSEKAVRPTTPIAPRPEQQNGDALVNASRRVESVNQQQPKAVLDALDASTTREKHERKKNTPDKKDAVEPPKAGLDAIDSIAATAKLEAEISRRLKEYAERPREVSYGSRVREYEPARYIDAWRRKVERIGTHNYPVGRKGKLYGSLMLTVSINSDGSLEKIVVARSSGSKELDFAAVRIVRMGAPYGNFGAELIKKCGCDRINISRTWNFTNDNLLQTE